MKRLFWWYKNSDIAYNEKPYDSRRDGATGYTLSEAWSEVNWAELMAARGAIWQVYQNDNKHDALDGV